MFYVYVYYEPITMKPFYVGKGSGDRAWDHILLRRCDKDSLLKRKITNMINNNEVPIISFYKTDLTEIEALELERVLVKHWGRLDIGTGILFNQTNGGQGFSGYQSRLGVEQSIDARIKISQAQTKRTIETEKKNRDAVVAIKGRPVTQFDLITGKIIRTYDSVRAVAKRGFRATCVREVVEGRLKSSGGYGWRDSIIEDYSQEKLNVGNN